MNDKFSVALLSELADKIRARIGRDRVEETRKKAGFDNLNQKNYC